LDKTRRASDRSIAFFGVENDGFDLSPSRKPIPGSDLPKLTEELQKFLVEDSKFKSKLTRISAEAVCQDENFYLSAERYSENKTSPDAGNFIKIGDLLEPAENGRVGDKDVPVMSITMANGLVDQADKFKKRIASESIADYKLVKRNDLVVGFPIDEGVLGFLTKYQEAAVSPAYGIWKLKPGADFTVEYLERLLRSEAMREIYRSKMQGAIGRRRNIPKDVFLEILLPRPNKEVQNKIEALAARTLSLKDELEANEADLQSQISLLWKS
ncbi:MAG: hypothetical protein RLZZ277_829, partial [Actinomycetota bacterium]